MSKVYICWIWLVAMATKLVNKYNVSESTSFHDVVLKAGNIIKLLAFCELFTSYLSLYTFLTSNRPSYIDAFQTYVLAFDLIITQVSDPVHKKYFAITNKTTQLVFAMYCLWHFQMCNNTCSLFGMFLGILSLIAKASNILILSITIFLLIASDRINQYIVNHVKKYALNELSSCIHNLIRGRILDLSQLKSQLSSLRMKVKTLYDETKAVFSSSDALIEYIDRFRDMCENVLNTSADTYWTLNAKNTRKYIHYGLACSFSFFVYRNFDFSETGWIKICLNLVFFAVWIYKMVSTGLSGFESKYIDMIGEAWSVTKDMSDYACVIRSGVKAATSEGEDRTDALLEGASAGLSIASRL